MKERILYFHNGLSSFVERDIEILKEKFEIIEFYFNVKNKKKLPLQFIKQLIFLLKYPSIRKYVTQFGGFHSFLPSIFSKVFNKKHAIILSGTDCVSFPSIGYGNFNRKLLAFFTKKSLVNASILLPVSKELVKYQYTYQNNDFPFQGYKYHVSKINIPYKVIHYGYDASKWNFNAVKEEKSFITVASDLSTRFGIKLKGIDLILEIAVFFPDCKFYIVGGKKINKELFIPNNVYLLDLIPNSELKNLLATKQFYMQLSMSEGFPNALCESMLCGCIPIVSNVSSMPFIIGDTGFILEKKDISLLESLINNIFKSNLLEINSLKARKRIEENFSIEKRKEKLLNVLQNYEV